MAFKKVRYLNYVADEATDLALISESEIGTSCYVIKEAAEYRLTSKGQWVKQIPPSAGSGSGSVDLTGYATEEYVDNAVAAIEHPTVDLSNYATKEYTDAKAREVSNKIPSVEGLATETALEEVASNPILKAFDFTRNSTKEDGQSIYLTLDDTTTLAQAMQEKGLGLYNIWIQKGRSDLPASMIADNTSGRGFACVDLQTKAAPANFIGYVVLFDKLNNMYYKFFNKGTEGSWMKISAVEDN